MTGQHEHRCQAVRCDHARARFHLPTCSGCNPQPSAEPVGWGRCAECDTFVRLVEPGGNLPPFYAHVVPVRGHVAMIRPGSPGSG